MQLDIDFVRQQFSQLADEPDFVFASNAGGSYVCNQVNELFEHYNRHTRVQPYSDFASSRTAGQAMDRAKDGWALALNIDPAELTIGPSTSINTYVMAQAIGSTWKEGDEIVVTNQDHEANSGVWRRKAEEKGVTLREWRVEPDSGLLDLDKLLPLLNENSRWVFFTHCSNIVGTSNPVKAITAAIKSHCAARVFVDAVAYAPHHICDMHDLGVDGYVFSLYKVFGPHQSLMYINSEAWEEMRSQAHYFLIDEPAKAFNPAGPQHAQVAACAGVLDYFSDLYGHHFPGKIADWQQKLGDLHQLIQAYESQLAAPILDYLNNRADVRLIGKSGVEDADRAPTIAFQPLNRRSADVAATMQQAGIGTENGNFYAHRLIEDLGIDTEDGVVRLSLLHYSRMGEVEQILKALDLALNA